MDCTVASTTLVSTLNSFNSKIKIKVKNVKILTLFYTKYLIEAYILYSVIF